MCRGKNCTRCKRWFPLFMFKTDIRKYQLKTAMGKVMACRLCLWKESGKGSVVRWVGNDFKTVTLTFKQRVIEFLKK